MTQRIITIVIGILLLTGLLIWINAVNVEFAFPDTAESGTEEAVPWWAWLLPWQGSQQRSIKIRQGLDLQGGLQVVLEADLPAGQALPPATAARLTICRAASLN
jgi:preprotein translocase subunit SecD